MEMEATLCKFVLFKFKLIIAVSETAMIFMLFCNHDVSTIVMASGLLVH